MDSYSTESFQLEDSFQQSPSYSKCLSRFSTWSTHCSEVDVDEEVDAMDLDLDEEQYQDEEVTTPALSESGRSENSGSGDDDTPQATPRAQDSQEEEETRRFFPRINTPDATEEDCVGTTAPLRIQRPNLKRYGKYIPMASAPFTPPEDTATFEPYFQSPSASDAFDIVSWKLQALTVAQPKLALTPPTPFNERASWGTTTPTRRETPPPKAEEGEEKRWRRALYFASDNSQVNSSAGLRVLLQSMEELQ